MLPFHRRALCNLIDTTPPLRRQSVSGVTANICAVPVGLGRDRPFVAGSAKSKRASGCTTISNPQKNSQSGAAYGRAPYHSNFSTHQRSRRCAGACATRGFALADNRQLATDNCFTVLPTSTYCVRSRRRFAAPAAVSPCVRLAGTTPGLPVAPVGRPVHRC